MKATATAVQQSIAAWRRVNAREALLAARDLPGLDTARTLAYLRPAFVHAHRGRQPALTSGLIEQQRWFQKLHGR